MASHPLLGICCFTDRVQQTIHSHQPKTAKANSRFVLLFEIVVITVRDFAYPKTHPYHSGQYPPEPEYEESDIEEDEEEVEEDDEVDYEQEDDEDRTQGQARGLYDFDAENESELSFREGDIVWIHCRQFPGWFLGEIGGATGLVPENYVQFV